MQKQDFDFALPDHLIAQTPAPERTAARLLCADLESQTLTDRTVHELPQLLCAGDLLVLNDTRVIKARLQGRKSSGGRVEVLIERLLGNTSAIAQIRASKAPKPGTVLVLDAGVEAEVTERIAGGLYHLNFAVAQSMLEFLERYGQIPLPPYIHRESVGDCNELDSERYQTVFANTPGAVAAPTAGLHFDARLLQELHALGVMTTTLTLHIGAGTFQPLRAEYLDDQRLHSEWCEVPAITCDAVNLARAEGRRVIAVGTTVVRSLETAASSGVLAAWSGETDLFIKPGYVFQTIDGMLTNFHLPQSSLFVLVAAFAGLEWLRQAYQHAIAEQYRFYSYGDAMLLLNRVASEADKQ